MTDLYYPVQSRSYDKVYSQERNKIYTYLSGLYLIYTSLSPGSGIAFRGYFGRTCFPLAFVFENMQEMEEVIFSR